ncbi:helix-turn-helix domain-containing protein [Amycolatopsis sp. NPDC058986]|uniref:helix-turn-helix domain-containing protein n=1 Tax=unclassified Amycolatopsis TaxID=2618356 RepID=UPI00366E7534
MSGSTAKHIARWHRLGTMAEDIYQELERRRRREAELAALFRTAGDLAALRDLDQVLQAIVHRARALLQADVSYLALHDPERGDTYMRMTSGSVSAAFQRLRLPMGAGLGGLVAQTAAPYATPDYPSDSRFQHTRSIDDAVSEEGLIGILGVPLRLGSAVIGVLFAADRRQRPFPAEEVSLLGSLADHAAIAIDNARRLQETRAALTELATTTQLLRERTTSLERAADAHDRLTDLVLRGGSLSDVAGAVTDVLGGSLLVLDAAGRRLCGEFDDENAITVARAHSRVTRSEGRWIARIAAGAEQLGALVLSRETELDDGEQRILERAALATAVLLLLRRSAAEAEHRVRGDLLADLILTPHRDPDRLTARADALGIDLAQPHTVVVVDAGEHEPHHLGRVLVRLATAKAGLATRHHGRHILLLPGDDPGAAARAVATELGVTTGAAGPATGLAAIPGAHDEATRCLDALLAFDRVGEGACLRDLGFLGLVIGRHSDLPGFVHDVVGPVLDYDRRRGTELVSTVEAYFAAGRSPARACGTLHVHVNTVTQRLERVTTLLGEDWQEPERSLEIQLALKLHRATTPRR